MPTIETTPDHPDRADQGTTANQLPDWLTLAEVTTPITDRATAAGPPQAKLEPVGKMPECAPHNDPRNYIATPCRSRDGWERVSCSKCDCFVGYRPKEAKPDHIDIGPRR